MKPNIIRTIMQSEITWIIMIVGAVMGFVGKVILPLNSIQIQLFAIQNQINELRSYDARITSSANDIIVLQQEIKSLLK